VGTLTLTLTIAGAAALRDLFEKELSMRRAFVRGAGGAHVGDACELRIESCGRSHAIACAIVYVRDEEPGRGVGLALPDDADAMAKLRAFALEADDDGDPPKSDNAPARRDDKNRSLTTVEQQKLASTGTLTERIAVERTYGANVWETLLRNPRLTIPEVARIARKGTLPRPLVELIATNASWTSAGEVQRALLSNPRSSSAVVARVLGAMPRGDLLRVPQQTAYPATVRAAAKKLLGHA
jgi:hypothetical protein